ncbi:MAG: hypothetical protein RLZZ303_3092 [Candidatus Hydrogenedentota bacterium]|jgi:arylsulfatase A-like enzyme
MNSISRRRFLEQAGLAGALLGACPLAGRAQEPPPAGPSGKSNVVLVMLDTLRADKCGCYGYPADTTSELDKLAARGVVFERVFSQCSWTKPSVGSLLSSLHPRSLGLYEEKNQALNDRFATLGKTLKAAGFRTFGATANPNLNTLFNFHQGFDKYIDTQVVFHWMRDQAPGKDVRGPSPLPGAPALFGEALAWAQAQPEPQQARHFIQLNLMEVHEWYAADSYSMRRAPYNEMFRQGTQYDRWTTHPNRRQRWHRYLQMARQLTDDLGDFVAKLSVLPGWQDTLFVFLSDHGEGLESHIGVDRGEMHGFLLYESNVVVPLVLYHPAWQPKVSRVKQPMRLLDVMPTVLDLAGVPKPDPIEGVSLYPVIAGEAEQVALPPLFVAETAWYPKYEKLAGYRPDWNVYDNYGGHPGLPPWELQRARERELGGQTSQAKSNPGVLLESQLLLRNWDKQHPKAPPTPVDRDMTQQEIEQLEAIGYLGG